MCGTKLRVGWLLWLPLLLVFSPSFSVAQEASGMTTEAIISELLTNLERREQILSEREQLLLRSEENLNEQARYLQTIEQSLSERETSVERRLVSLSEIENSLKSFANAVKWEIWGRNIAIGVLGGLALWGWLR